MEWLMSNFITRWLEKRFTLKELEPWKPWLGYSSKTGVNVTEDTALRATAVWACVRLLAETVASLPLFIYKRLERGK
jgi:phage portal protein BeeE